jgi:type IV secretory pathway VirB2 component (pilin)
MNLKKLNFFAFIFFLFLAVPLSAQILPAGMTTLSNEILNIFLGPFVRTILIICLAATAVVFGFNKDNEKMKKNCLAIGIAVAVLIAAQGIVEAVWKASGGTL